MPLGLLFRLCGGGCACAWVCLAGQDAHLNLLKPINTMSGVQNQNYVETHGVSLPVKRFKVDASWRAEEARI